MGRQPSVLYLLRIDPVPMRGAGSGDSRGTAGDARPVRERPRLSPSTWHIAFLTWHIGSIVASPDNVVNVGPQGRIVIPARIRRELGLDEGTPLAVHAEGGRLVLEPRGAVLRRLRGRYAGMTGKRRLSDELLRDRREEARRETGR